MRIKIYLPALVCLSLILFLGCRKSDHPVVKTETPATSFSISDAKVWYATLPKGGMVGGKKGATSKIKSFEPNWSNAKSNEDESYYIVETSLSLDKTPGFSIHGSSAKTDTTKIKGKTKLLVLKSKKTGKIKAVLMHVASTNSTGEEISYNPKNTNFSGYIFFTDLEGNYINGWQYENGKVIRQGRSSSKMVNGLAAPIGETPGVDDCYVVVTDWYERDCNEYYDEHVECTEWTYIGSTYETYCTSSGGGGGCGGVVEEPEVWNNDNSIGKLCGNYTFAAVGNSFTGTVNNLQWNFRSPQGVQYTITYAESCLSIANYNINQAQASAISNEAFNAATNQVLAELNAGTLSPSGIQVRLKTITQGNFASLKPGSTWSAVGPCAGTIPVTKLTGSAYCP